MRRRVSRDFEQTPVAKVEGGGFDLEVYALNVARMIEAGGKVLAAYLRPRETGQVVDAFAIQVVEAVSATGKVGEYWLSDPRRAFHLQARLGKAYLDLWTRTVKRVASHPADPGVEPDPKDKRFSDPEWASSHYFDFLKQHYLLSVQLAEYLVRNAKSLDQHTRHKAQFYVRQILNAVSPSNFIPTNPELLRETLASNAENLVRGMRMLAEDIEAGQGDLKIRHSDPTVFRLGRDLALTPGKVIYENELMQLIQYAPATERVLKRPILIVPPWINKFYILDLTPDKSFIKWCVDQGLTIFVVSWVNPDARQAMKSFADYMREGVIEALKVVEEVTGESEVHTVGYCVGGTLLAVTLAYLAAERRACALSATLLAAQVDFAHAGDLRVFIDERQISALEKEMARRGYLSGKTLKTTFNLLRSNDMIWSYVINNYLKGKMPFPFDLLHWNSDSVRMPAANHSFYLRNCYLHNRLSKGEMEIDGVRLNLRKVKVPVYNLAAREDHIAPAKSILVGCSAFGGPVRFVLAGSGHIAGVVNPPAQNSYQYWTGGDPQGDSVEAWRETAVERPGSWWPDWLAFVREQDRREVKAPEPGGGKLAPLEDAPGSYVRVRE